MNHKVIIVLSIGIFLWNKSFSQDTLLLMNGRTISTKVISIIDDEVKYLYKGKEKIMDKYRIFSISYEKGSEEILYEEDTLVGRYYSVEQMKEYLYGEQDAIKGFKAPMATLSGILLCGTGGYLLADNLLVVTIPLVYTSIGSLSRINIKSHYVRDKSYLSKPAYILGYEQVARNKKILNILKGSILGIGLGITTFYLIPQ